MTLEISVKIRFWGFYTGEMVQKIVETFKFFMVEAVIKKVFA